MSNYQLLLPKMGESVAEATIIKWLKNPGDFIEADEAVLEIATDKVDSEVPSPVSGKLITQLYNADDVVQVGSPIALIQTEADAANTVAPAAPPPVVEVPVVEEAPAPAAQPEAQQVIPAPQPETPTAATVNHIPGVDQLESRPAVQQSAASSAAKATNVFSGRFYSPLVKSIASQEGISIAELDTIPGTGAEGRLTKDDLLNYIKNRFAQPAATAEQPVQTATVAVPTPAVEESRPVVTATPEPPKQEPISAAAPQVAPPQPEQPRPQPVAPAPKPVEQQKPVAPPAQPATPQPVAEAPKAQPQVQQPTMQQPEQNTYIPPVQQPVQQQQAFVQPQPQPVYVQQPIYQQPQVFQAPPVYVQQPIYQQPPVYQAPPVYYPGQPVYQQPEYIPQPEQPKPSSSSVSISGEDEIIEMDRMRRLIAEHMVNSKKVSPHVTSFIEVDVTNLVMWREKVKNHFEAREKEKLTFTPIFIEAVASAIKDLPMINVSVDGTNIIKRKNINIGMATALPSGNLIVPVIRKADELSLTGLAKAVNDLANRARKNKLKPEEIKDGTFTITNVGTFGNVMGTPIINQPQVAILAIGAIKKKPAVMETKNGDVITIRHMMFLSLSYDHRVVDGSLGGAFIKKVSDYLEAWDINRAV